MLRSRWLLLLLPFLLLLTDARAAPLIDPPPIALPAGVASDRVANAAHQAFLHRDWAIAAEQPRRIEGALSSKEHAVRVAINYSALRSKPSHPDAPASGPGKQR